MTEAEWIAIGDAETMIVWLQEQGHDPHGRKDQLLAVACCRRLWDLLPEPQREAVEAAERCAEGGEVAEVDWQRLADAVEDCEGFEVSGPIARSATHAVYASFIDFDISRVFDGCANARGWDEVLWRRPAAAQNEWSLRRLSYETLGTLGEAAVNEFHAAESVERWQQCILVAEVYGHLFHDATINPDWLAWNGGTVRRLAEACYADRDFEHLPILADALEDAGCTDDTLLSHLHSPGPHVRACWALDSILGKE